MQGRLLPPSEPGRIQSFPRDGWRAEFELASRANLACIEWIYDAYGRDVNPIANDAGIREMRRLEQESSVQVTSLVADYFMDHVLTTGPENEAEFVWLLRRCKLAGIQRVVVPFVDNSSLKHANRRKVATRVLERLASIAEEVGVELHLETDLAPSEFAEFLDAVNHPLVRVNYDSGNSAALGFDVHEEFAAYGTRIGSVHLKDRIRRGTTVALGHGHADFNALFEQLQRIQYTGDLILQVARGNAGAELDWAEQNRRFFEPYVQLLTA